MHAYLVSVQQKGIVKKFAIASTQLDAKHKRDELLNDFFGVSKSDCNIETIDIPTSKQELLDFINEQIANAFDCGNDFDED